ncbi:sulfotransferase family 2 domain-containing protein [Chromohalobacter israelensis]|uniref:sulfotransferase family 2 domain-containing protein n=1 Tax=Chromohalobacter israelensis TaxID=141390 RepID=UPI003AF8CA23
MIISDHYRFAFVHIPKCAGITVRNKLKRYDDLRGEFENRVENHPELGMLDYVHIPLSTLKEYFSDEYRKVESYRAFCVVRDPYSRFGSSLSQRIKMYCGGLQKISRKELAKELDKTIEFLTREASLEQLPAQYIHFQRQVSYIYVEGRQVVDQVFLVERLDKLYDYIEYLSGEPVAKSDERLNQALAYKNQVLKNVGEVIRPIARMAIPGKLKGPAHKVLDGIFYDSSDKMFKEILSSSYVEDFVAEYYSEDIVLYDSLKLGVRL